MKRRLAVSWRILVCFATLTTLPLLLGCGSSGSGGDQPKVTLLVPDLTAPYWGAAVKGAEAGAKAAGVDLTVAGTPVFSVSQYNAQIQAALTRGTDGLLLGPEDPTASNSLISQATRQGTPVGLTVIDAPDSDRKFFIGPNATDLGRGQAQRALSVLKATGAHGEIQAAITSCAPTALSQVQERNAFTQTVENENQYKHQFTVKVVTFLNATSDAATNLSTYDNLATAHPDVKLVFPECVVDAESAGTIAQKRQTGWIVAADGWTPKILDLTEQGFVTFAVNEAPYETLEKAVTIMGDGIRGTKPLPQGVQSFPLDVAVKTPGQWPMPEAAHVLSTSDARKSPDAVGD